MAASSERWSAFLRTRLGPLGLGLLVLLAVVAVIAPLLAPSSPSAIVGEGLLEPSGAHLMGTDNVGRDVLSVVIYGTRVSLLVGLLSATIALVIGAVVGGIAGYYRGWAEAVLMRISELFQTLPAIVVVLFVVAMLGSHFWLLIVAISLAIWPLEARIIYGQFVTLRERNFVAAARVAGMPARRIIVREILPNALPPVIVQVSLDAGLAILVEAGLGFLGLSDPAVPSWGQLLFDAQPYLQQAWWMSVFPGVGIVLAVLAFNLLGDALNDVVNPRRRASLSSLRRQVDG